MCRKHEQTLNKAETEVERGDECFMANKLCSLLLSRSLSLGSVCDSLTRALVSPPFLPLPGGSWEGGLASQKETHPTEIAMASDNRSLRVHYGRPNRDGQRPGFHAHRPELGADGRGAAALAGQSRPSI